MAILKQASGEFEILLAAGEMPSGICPRRGLRTRIGQPIACATLLAALVTLPAARSHAHAAQPDQPPLTVRIEPELLQTGAPFLVRVNSASRLKTLTGSWREHKVFFSYDLKTGDWYGLAGVGLTTEPGDYPLALRGLAVDGREVIRDQKLHVETETYPTVTLRVQGKFTAPSAKQQARIERESELKKQIFAHSSDEKLWSGGFVAPIGTATSEGFGVKRVFNGEVKSRHQGLDYHAARGTPVTAANTGRVVLARRLFFEGGCVILDHGQGLMTLYMHLSKLLVKEGQSLRKRQRLGFSGATGRATGPHLHVAVRWEGAYLDPAKLFSLQLPAGGRK